MLDQTGYIKKFIISYTLLEYFGGIVRWKTTNVKGTRISVRGEAQTPFHLLPLPQSGARDRLFWRYFL